MSEHHPKLGQLISDSARKDAIHIAVAPVMAGHALARGERVRVEAGIAHRDDEGIGIVDPFLKDRVERGQMFWLILDPGTTTNLRHEWDHPSLPDESESEAAEYDDCAGC